MDSMRRLASAWLAAWEKPAASAAAAFAGDPRTLSVGGAWLSAQLAVQRALIATLDSVRAHSPQTARPRAQVSDAVSTPARKA
jgi:hypothetical protein